MRQNFWGAVSAVATTALVMTSLVALASESGQVKKGAELYKEFCERCHGVDGQRGEGTRIPIWGPAAPRDKFKTVQELFDYLQFLMPFDKPEKVTDEQRWDIIAYMMVRQGVMKPSETLDPAKAGAIAFAMAPDAPGPAAPTAAPTAATPAAAKTPAPASALAKGSAEAGEDVFRKCRACHEIGPGAKNKLGPALNGIIGRRAGTIEGFNYSDANRMAGEKGLVWTEAELDTYLADPRAYMPGNRMAFAGIDDAQDRADLIAYLKAASK